MEGLGQRLALALLGRQRVGQESRAALGQLDDRLGAAREQIGKEDAGQPDPEEESRLREDEARRFRLADRRMGDRLQDVSPGRDGRGQGRHRRAKSEGDGDRHDEKPEPRVRERAARQRGEQADRRDVHARADQRKPRSDGPEVDPGEHARAPGGERCEREQERRALGVRVGEALCEREQADRRESKPGDDPLGFDGFGARFRRPAQPAHELLDQAPAHRGRDCGRPVGHAELLVQVLHVRLDGREAEVELLRDLGQALARCDQVQDLLLPR